ncbi:MAG: hypothetical protein ABUS79_10475 [Pseudomonadota bacterium]
MVDRYASPKALKIYCDPTQRTEVGALTAGAWKAREFGPAGVWLDKPGPKEFGVRCDGEHPDRSWLPLPLLARTPNEAAAFSGAVMRIMRADWQGAADLLRTVLALPTTPTAVRVDALLYLGLSDEKQGRSGRKHFEEALALNPLSAAAARYLVMNAFAESARAPTADRAAARQRATDLLARTTFLFAADDPWLRAATALANDSRPSP